MNISGSTVFKECDDTNSTNGDGCNGSCDIESGFVCIYSDSTHKSICSKPSVCGDGSIIMPMKVNGVNVSKQCDDKNTSNNDGCNS